MPRCKNHRMPWYVAVPLALFLFLLAPFFRKWVDVVLWPKIANWWASRSRLTLQKRILKLEATLTRVEALPTLGEFEDLVLRSINGIVALLVIIPLLAAMAYVIAFCDPAFSLIPKDWYRQVLLLLLAFVHCLTGCIARSNGVFPVWEAHPRRETALPQVPGRPWGTGLSARSAC